MSKKWVVLAKGADFDKIARDFHISPYLARIIRNRGAVTYDEIDMFLNCDLAKMHDPSLLPDIENACSVLEDAIDAQIRIRIVGDYDIDGVCASYILQKGLESVGAQADVRLPERIKDGYGLNENIVKEAYEDGVELLITCDNGIAAADEIETAVSLGMSVIVTDHHEVPYTEENGQKKYRIPCADAVIDPKCPGSGYPFEGICGAMVAYKLISYLYEHADLPVIEGDKDALLADFLSFAAFATVGDLMELRDENRIAVRYGLDILKKTDNAGMRALIDATGIDKDKLSAYHIGFILGPCVNATGRLETADKALELFTEDDPARAQSLAKDLVKLNAERKNMTTAFANKAVRLAEEEYRDDKVLVVYLPGCHESLAGIVAGRLREHFYRPAIVLTDDAGGDLKGSGRSIDSYPMYDELCKVSDLFTKFGGHKMAAGLSMKAGMVDELRRRLNETATLSEEDLTEKMKIDIPLPVGYVNINLINELAKLEPYGISNPRPLFAQKDVPIRSVSLLGQNKNLLKLVLEGSDANGSARAVEAVYFGETQKAYEELRDRKSVSVLYQPGINEYRGSKNIQLTIVDYM